MRDLTASEEEFVNLALINRDTESKEEKQQKKKRAPKRWWQKVSTWAAVIMSIPFILTFIFSIMLFRMRAILGDEGMKLLLESSDSDELKKEFGGMDLSWLENFREIYEMKAIIIGSFFIAAIIIVAIMFTVDAIIEKKRNEREFS